MKFCFGDIVVVEESLIGVVVKSWVGKTRTHDVYVRDFNGIQSYEESKLQRYMVRHKELNDEELEYQRNSQE